MPPEILQYIFEFDSTYHEVYAKVLHQLRFKCVFWNHFYSPKAWILQFFKCFGDAAVNRWVFRGEEFYWEMYTPAEYETYVGWRIYLHRSVSAFSTRRSMTRKNSHASIAE